MVRSVHAFVRGSTALFYDWLTTHAGRGIPQGPTLWICGDAHVGNLGPIARCDERVEVEVRDLDQGALGNPAIDLVRLALSLAMAARSSDLPGVLIAQLVEELTHGYLQGLAGHHEDPSKSKSTAVRFFVREALRRKWQSLFRERLGDKTRIRLGKDFWPLSEEERASVVEFLSLERVRQLVTSLDCRDDDAQIRLRDAAYWVKGCSSLGLWRCAAVVDVLGQRSRKGGACLLDLKQAIEPLSARLMERPLPRHQGERVVAAARALSSALGQRMLYGTVANHEVFARELMPQDLKLELQMLTETEARATTRELARVIGRAHGRQLMAGEREEWSASLERSSSRGLDAPGWLWSSVVELVAVHERAYLEHCRRYALKL